MSVRIVEENRGAEGFGEDVHKIVYAGDKVHLNIPPKNFFTNKIKVNLYVFCKCNDKPHSCRLDHKAKRF